MRHARRHRRCRRRCLHRSLKEQALGMLLRLYLKADETARRAVGGAIFPKWHPVRWGAGGDERA